MPPRKRGTSRIAVAIPADDGDDDEMTPSSATEAALEDAALNAKTRDPIAKVYRVNTSGKNIYLDQVSLAIVNEEWLAETYGGGQYQVYRMGEREGRWGFLGSEKYEIDESLPFKGSLRKQNADKGRFVDDDDDRVSFHNPDGSRIGGAAGPSSTMVDAAVFNLLKSHQDNAQVSQQFFLTMMEQMRQSSAMERQMMTAMLEKQTKNNPLDAVMPLLTVLAPKFLEMAMNKRDSIETILPILEKLTPKDEGQKLDDLLSLAGKMRETAEVFGGGGGGGGGGGIWDALGKALEVLPSLIQQQTVPRAASASAAIAPPMQIPGAAPTMPQTLTDPTMVPPGEDGIWSMMRQHIGKLKMAAMTNRNPMRVAMVTVEFASDPEKALLVEVLSDDTFTEAFLDKFPEMKSYTVWTTNYIEALRDELLGPAFDEDPDEDESEVQDATPTTTAPVKGKGKVK